MNEIELLLESFDKCPERLFPSDTLVLAERIINLQQAELEKAIQALEYYAPLAYGSVAKTALQQIQKGD